MKLNKKVLTGALALAMGLGVVAPAANSFAANESAHPGFTEEYATATKKYNAALKALREQEKVVEKAKADEKAAFEAYKKAVEDADNTAEALEVAEAKVTKRDTEKKAAIEEYAKKVDDEALKTADDVIEHYKDYADKDNENIIKLYKAVTTANSLHLEAVEEQKAAQEANNKAKDEKDKALETLANATKTLKDELEVLGEDKGDKSTELYEAYYSAKKEALKAGVNKAIIEKAEEKGEFIEVPGEEEEDLEDKEDLDEKIEEQLKVNKEKLAGLKVVKEMMPESYKRYKDTIDTAIANAEKAIKAAEDYLGTKVSFLTVSFAADDKTGEEILKDLEDSEKELDDAMSQVEEDNKAKNEADEKEEEEKEDEETEGTEEDEETEGTEEDEETEGTKEDDKPVVEEKEDVKPANNVKTGVAGVAGVGAVLAAASAAYVSSKRK